MSGQNSTLAKSPEFPIIPPVFAAIELSQYNPCEFPTAPKMRSSFGPQGLLPG